MYDRQCKLQTVTCVYLMYAFIFLLDRVAAYWYNRYKYIIVNLVFLTSDFFLIAPFPDHCLLVPLCSTCVKIEFSLLLVTTEQLICVFVFSVWNVQPLNVSCLIVLQLYLNELPIDVYKSVE